MNRGVQFAVGAVLGLVLVGILIAVGLVIYNASPSARTKNDGDINYRTSNNCPACPGQQTRQRRVGPQDQKPPKQEQSQPGQSQQQTVGNQQQQQQTTAVQPLIVYVQPPPPPVTPSTPVDNGEVMRPDDPGHIQDRIRYREDRRRVETAKNDECLDCGKGPSKKRQATAVAVDFGANVAGNKMAGDCWSQSFKRSGGTAAGNFLREKILGGRRR